MAKMSGNDVPMSAALLGEHSGGADRVAGDVRRRNRSDAGPEDYQTAVLVSLVIR